MARFPIIESPCPIAGKRVPNGASEHCSTCDRAVFNLNSMNDTERRAFMNGCSGKVCVAYTVRMPARRGPFAAAALAAAALMALPAAATDADQEKVAPATTPADAAQPAADLGELPRSDHYDEMELVGGVLDAENAEWADDAESAPALPTVADDGR